MSKINPTQLAALQAPATAVAKVTTKKLTVSKNASTKTAAAKPTEKPTAKLTPTPKPMVKPAEPAKKSVTKPVIAKAKIAVKVTAKDTTKDSKDKPRKAKMERDSFTMPKDEYAQIALMKARLLGLGQPAKKSELLRAGVKLLAAMSDATLKSTLAAIPVIKTGRPNKH